MTVSTSALSRRAVLSLASFASLSLGRAAGAIDLTMIDTVAFEVSPGGHLLVSAQVAGRRLNALLDTGAASNVVDTQIARALTLPVTKVGVAAGMTGDVAVGSVSLPPIFLGAHQLRAGAASALDLTPFSLSSGRPIELVLGQPFFENVWVEIDFAERELRIAPLSVPEPVHERQLPLDSDDHGRLTVPVMLGGLRAVQAMHDLGSGIPIYVSPAYAENNLLLVTKKVSKSATVGAEGLSFSQISTLESISIAGFVIRDVPFQVPSAWNQKSQVVVGLPVWSRFRSLIDLRGKKLGLTPDYRLAGAPFSRDRSGIGAQRLSDRLRILFVSPGSPAEAAGLVAGDEIVRIDGEPVGPALYQRRPRPGAEPTGTVEELGLASGRRVTITLADYF